MSPDAQRIAIAEACGWKQIREHDCQTTSGDVFQIWQGILDEHPEPLPDYLLDLNAMHEAEKILVRELLFSRYGENLGLVCLSSENPRWHATAVERAEAFLRTLNKWSDQ